MAVIAREVGCSRSSVTKYAPQGAFDRGRTEAATRARVVDAAARRAELAGELLEKAGAVLDRLDGDHVAFGWFGKDGEYREKHLAEPPAADVRALAGAVSSLLATHLRLVQHDTGNGDDEGAAAILEFGAALRADYEQRHGTGPA